MDSDLKIIQSMQGYYANRAPEYDDIYRKPERQSDLRQLEHFVSQQFHNNKVLEIACGTGYWTSFIAAQAKVVWATDTSPEVLQLAAQRLQATHPQAVHKVDFLQANAYHLDPELGQFDAAFAGFWFSHMPKNKVSEFLVGLAQRLQSGATVMLLDNRYVPGSSTPICETDAEGNTYQWRPLADGSQHKVLKNFPTLAELESCISSIGVLTQYRVLPYYWTLIFQVK